MEETQTQTPEDQELALAMKALADAKERKARAEKMALDKAAADLAAHRAAEEKKLADARAEAEAIQKRWQEKRAAEETARKVVEAQRKAVEDRLSQELSKREEEKRIAEKKAAEIKAIQEAAFNAEREAQALEQSLLQARTPKEEEKPVTLQDPRHPLSRIFGNGAEAILQPLEIDSVEQAKQNAVPTVKSDVWRVVKHGHGNNFVNSSTSYLLEQTIKKELAMQPNTQTLDRLSSLFDESDLVIGLRLTISAYKQRAMGHDQFMGLWESTLEAACQRS
jgi:hypothetical protein